MPYDFILIVQTEIRTFKITSAEELLHIILIQIDITDIALIVLIIYIIYTIITV